MVVLAGRDYRELYGFKVTQAARERPRRNGRRARWGAAVFRRAGRAHASNAQALIECQPHTNTPDELQLLSMVNAWRLQYVP